MDTNRLSQTLAAVLNAQMTKEAHASQIYLSYASWANNQGFGGIANFLFRHAEEEQWFVKEQVEEETLAMNLLDKLKIAGGEKVSSEGLYSLDRDLKDAPDSAGSAEEVTVEKP